jgi:hypothetical protein
MFRHTHDSAGLGQVASRIHFFESRSAVSDLPPQTEAPTAQPPKVRSLNEADAVEIWIARWLRVRPMALVARYGCDPRRLYDIWWGHAFPASRVRAQKAFLERYPSAADRTDFGYRRIPRGSDHDPRQGGLFDAVR